MLKAPRPSISLHLANIRPKTIAAPARYAIRTVSDRNLVPGGRA